MNQGEIYWIDLGVPLGSAPGHRHPCVIVQNDLINRSAIRTAIVCVLTTNIRRGLGRGNVILDPGEGDLPRQSVVNVSQIITIDRSQLEDYVGLLGPGRVREIVDGIRLLIEPRD